MEKCFGAWAITFSDPDPDIAYKSGDGVAASILRKFKSTLYDVDQDVYETRRFRNWNYMRRIIIRRFWSFLMTGVNRTR